MSSPATSSIPSPASTGAAPTGRPGTRPTGPSGAATPGPAGPAGTRPRGLPSSGRAPDAAPAPTDEGVPAPTEEWLRHVGPAVVHPVGAAVALRRLAGWVAVLFLEVESGRRPAGQVAKLLDARLVARLLPVWCRPGAPGRVLSVAGMLTTADTYDAVAVVRRGERVGALGLRLVRDSGTWVVAELARAEDGPLPDPDFPPPGQERLDAFDLCDPDLRTVAVSGG